MAEFCLNTKFDWKEVEGVFKGRIQSLNGEKWFIPKFIEYQYGVLMESNRVHNSIIQILKKEGLYENKDCLRTILGSKDKEQDKDKDKDNLKVKHLDFVFLTKQEHQKLIDKFGSDLTRKYIERVNNYIGSKGKTYKSHYFTILSWTNKDGAFKPHKEKHWTDDLATEQHKENKKKVKDLTSKIGG